MAQGILIGMGGGLIICIIILVWAILTGKIASGKNSKRNCDNKLCPMNTLHASGKYHTCSIDVLSVVDGKCEFWEAYKQSKDAKKDV